MWSIALFPCSYTDGARIVGELSNSLRLPVYNDAILFAEVSEQFGVSARELTEVLYGKEPALRRNILKREKYVNLLRCSLEARRVRSAGRSLFYGLHTSLLDHDVDRVLKVLVFDTEENRLRRALGREDLREDLLLEQIRKQDEQLSRWTRWLFHKGAYDRSLYDVVIDCGNKDLFSVVALIIEHYQDLADSYPSCDVDVEGMVYSRNSPHFRGVDGIR